MTTHDDVRRILGLPNHDAGRICGLCGGDVPSGYRHEHGPGVCVARWPTSPFPPNDPFLPARDAQPTTCPACGRPGRDDVGCSHCRGRERYETGFQPAPLDDEPDTCQRDAGPSGPRGVVAGAFLGVVMWAVIVWALRAGGIL